MTEAGTGSDMSSDTATDTAAHAATRHTAPARPRSARRRARECALQGVYAWLLRGGEDETRSTDIAAHWRSDPELINAGEADGGHYDAAWFDTLLAGVLREANGLRARFAPYIDRALAELSPIEHAVLLIGSYELVHHVEVPYRVCINEAVELAKSFGGTDGFKFVNSVLDKLALEVRALEVQTAQTRTTHTRRAG